MVRVLQIWGLSLVLPQLCVWPGANHLASLSQFPNCKIELIYCPPSQGCWDNVVINVQDDVVVNVQGYSGTITSSIMEKPYKYTR